MRNRLPKEQVKLFRRHVVRELRLHLLADRRNVFAKKPQKRPSFVVETDRQHHLLQDLVHVVFRLDFLVQPGLQYGHDLVLKPDLDRHFPKARQGIDDPGHVPRTTLVVGIDQFFQEPLFKLGPVVRVLDIRPHPRDDLGQVDVEPAVHGPVNDDADDGRIQDVLLGRDAVRDSFLDLLLGLFKRVRGSAVSGDVREDEFNQFFDTALDGVRVDVLGVLKDVVTNAFAPAEDKQDDTGVFDVFGGAVGEQDVTGVGADVFVNVGVGRDRQQEFAGQGVQRGFAFLENVLAGNDAVRDVIVGGLDKEPGGLVGVEIKVRVDRGRGGRCRVRRGRHRVRRGRGRCRVDGVREDVFEALDETEAEQALDVDVIDNAAEKLPGLKPVGVRSRELFGFSGNPKLHQVPDGVDADGRR